MTYKTVYLHRIIAEQTLGRSLRGGTPSLRTGEIVHHLDEDKTNNSPENATTSNCTGAILLMWL
ncbi:HNH endonuclease [Microcoleus sp. herbarium14]|uniref:HNH endonuclease n=1 Tax=Microcoleus sp. herbarium14 TaxID=3055439 RepID=UPI002FD16FD3